MPAAQESSLSPAERERYAYFQARNLSGTLIDLRNGLDVVHLDGGYTLNGESWGISRGDLQAGASAFANVEVKAGGVNPGSIADGTKDIASGGLSTERQGR